MRFVIRKTVHTIPGETAQREGPCARHHFEEEVNAQLYHSNHSSILKCFCPPLGSTSPSVTLICNMGWGK